MPLTCLLVGEDDALLQEEYAAGFKLDQWYRFHSINGDETDQLFLRVSRLRDNYEPYDPRKGEGPETPAPGPLSLLCLPQGSTPDQHQTPTGSELADSEVGGTDLEESGDVPEESEVQGQDIEVFMSIRERDSDSESEDACRGRDLWRDACGQEASKESAEPVPRPRGLSRGTAKRPRLDAIRTPGRVGGLGLSVGEGRPWMGRRCVSKSIRPLQGRTLNPLPLM